MRPAHALRALAVALALSACGTEDETTATTLDELPEVAALTLETKGTSSQAMTLADDAAAILPATPQTNDDLAVSREKIAAVNEAVRSVFEHVEAVARAGGAPARGDARTYGPVQRCVVAAPCDASGSATLRLHVSRSFGTTWAFALEAQIGSEWRPVLAGWMRRGALVRRGAGRIAVNLDNLRAAAPAYPGEGYLLGGFSAGPVAKTLRYTLTGPPGSAGFTPDPARWAAATATYHGVKNAAGATRVRVAGLNDAYTGPSGDELVFCHLGFHPTVGGRAYSVVRNYADASGAHGDVPASQYFFSRACYAVGETTPRYKEWFLCAQGTGPAACIAEQGGIGTPDAGTPGGSWQTACGSVSEPAELQPPVGAPGAAPTDASAEPGESQEGIDAPEPPPASVDDVTP